MTIKHIAVLGAGTMGNGISQVCATSGYQVILIDVAPRQLEQALVTINRSVDKLHSKGRLTDEQREAALTNITTATKVAAAAEADFVVEAVIESLKVKQQVFAELDVFSQQIQRRKLSLQTPQAGPALVTLTEVLDSLFRLILRDQLELIFNQLSFC